MPEEMFTREELIKVLQEAAHNGVAQHDPQTITTSEFSEITGWKEGKALRTLKRLHRETELIAPEMVKRANLWGQEITVKGWRYVGPSLEPADDDEVAASAIDKLLAEE